MIRLCSGKFGREHGNAINLSNSDIARWCNEEFSARQVQRHIDDLALNSFIYVAYDEQGKRWISTCAGARCKSVPLISAGQSTSHAQNLLLSLLLNKAAFNARAGLEFTIKVTIDHLEHSLAPLTGKTIKNGLAKLSELQLINVQRLKDKALFISFCADLEHAYRDLIKLKRSANCEQIAYKRAVNKVLSAADPNFKAWIKQEKLRTHSRHQPGCAEVPLIKAETFADVQMRKQKNQLWQQAVSKTLHSTLCNKKQNYLKLTSKQVKEILYLSETKDASHNLLSETKDIAHAHFWKQKTHPTGANPHSNAVYVPLFTKDQLTRNEIFTRRDRADVASPQNKATLNTTNLENVLRHLRENLL